MANRSLTSAFSAVSIVVALTATICLAGCPKSKNDAPDATSATGSANTAVTGRATVADSDAAAGAAAPGASGVAPDAAGGSGGATVAAAAYSGTYTLTPATLHIPEAKDYAHVKQAKDDPSKLVGAGTLSLAVGADGRVSGEIDSGPASPATIDGTVVEGEIRGFVRRKTPSDEGLTGTLVAKPSGGGGDGKMSLAEANASILREGAITLKRK